MRNRPGEHARINVRREMARTVRANRPVLLVAAGILVVIGTVELLSPSPLWWRTYLLGFLTAGVDPTTRAAY